MDELEHIWNFDVTPGSRAGGGAVWPLKCPKSILYKRSHVAYQIEGNEE